MTGAGCKARDTAKELMLQEMIEDNNPEMRICNNQCCQGCTESCSYRCGRC